MARNWKGIRLMSISSKIPNPPTKLAFRLEANKEPLSFLFWTLALFGF
jgi:hypothetical protein